jgi:casein kinase 1
MSTIDFIGKKVANKYIICQPIGKGAFGEVYTGYDQHTHQEVAIKFELINTQKHSSQLINEISIYKVLGGNAGIPTVYYSGIEGSYNILVFEQLGQNFEILLTLCERSFSLKTLLLIGREMTTRIECLHKYGYIHRDIKPENFLIGRNGKSSTIYLIDFGLAKKYINPKTKMHIPFKENKKLTGTARYCSINTHMGLEQSRRDDMEGFMYCLTYFYYGELPWMGMRAIDKREKYEKIMETKMTTPIEILCSEMPSILIQ